MIYNLNDKNLTTHDLSYEHFTICIYLNKILQFTIYILTNLICNDLSNENLTINDLSYKHFTIYIYLNKIL
jgi:hypothetical protein